MITLPDIADRVIERKLTYLSRPKLRSLFEAVEAVKQAGVEGDFVEFGVALGGSAICIATQLDGSRRFLGYDVFGMIPPPSDRDGAGPNERYAVIKSGRSEGIGGAPYYGYVPDLLEAVRSNFSAFELPVDGNRIQLIQGRYEDSLGNHEVAPVAFAHVDCDWYESVRACLDYLKKQLSPGGVIVLDDYNDWEGCKTAVDEFCSENVDFKLSRTKPHAVLIREASGRTASATDMHRWANADNLADDWSHRSEKAVRFVPPGAVLMDIGCGKMAIEGMLPGGCTYIPVDLVKRDGRTLVCDLNKAEYPAADRVTHVSMLGVLEYLERPQEFFEWLKNSPAKRLIMSYIACRPDAPTEPRRKAGWINDFTREQIVELAEAAGFVPVEQERFKNNVLFAFDRAKTRVTHAESSSGAAGGYALFTYRTGNLGDEIQSLAARQFLPSTDALIDRDRPNVLPEDCHGQYKIIFNGWHTHSPENWPPSPDLLPLLVSMHLTDEIGYENKFGLNPRETLLKGKNLDYLRQHGPVGARDLWTRDLLCSNGVDAYFSGCMTLTLGAEEEFERQDYVCAVDLPDVALGALRKRYKGRLVKTTHEDSTTTSFEGRCERARRLLSIYAHARCVVTTRLHCALPCLALRTPVLLIQTAADHYRFSGLLELVRNATLEQFCEGSEGFDVNSPSPNGEDYLRYRKDLIARSTDFVGSQDSSAGVPVNPFRPARDPEPLIAIEQSMAELTSRARVAGKFRQVFKPGRDYAGMSKPDFLRDLSVVHRTARNLGEAKRLLESALYDRPNGTRIKLALDEVSRELALKDGGKSR